MNSEAGECPEVILGNLVTVRSSSRQGLVANDCGAVITLMTFSEMEDSGLLSSIENIQRSKKIFYYFPFNYKRNHFELTCILDALPKNREMTISVYHGDSKLVQTFLACVMLYSGKTLSDTLCEFPKLGSEGTKYVKRYAEN